ncbi:S41 family peptidase [Phototrophicus methaneseepsis]|uniref:S41 family peptidase n=1 Tax=Phototrophicus methaneseepsis TaxID=2710758 RepID=A0A7S8E5Y4_9CHLR|nr:S41 family peptidase [Phototrophicus methaneseepsis]QPC80903.1 S41 family peptidase [Phototrophicus methaneseepsis]
MVFIRKYAKKIQSVLLFLAIFAAGFAFGNLNPTSQAQAVFGDTEEAFAPLYQTFSLIQSEYVDAVDVDVPDLVDGAIQGMVESLGDQYSGYLDPDNYVMFNSDLSGDVEGIGVVIRTDEETGEIEVVNVLEGAAARAAGVLPGDIFWEVDGQSVTGLNQTELASLVRGPAGTDVTILFKRDEEFVEFTITRVQFSVPIVTNEVLDNNIAYLKLAEFNANARQELDAALAELDVNSRDGLIFDLRGNPGGLLRSAVDVASLFIEDGVILYESFGDGREDIFEATGNYGNIEVPIVVLVDEGSASASELVSGAMQDREVATLIGEVTFGKGTVQTIQPLDNGGGLRLTVARYLLPSRNWIHDVGVQPDIIVDWNPETVEELEGEDPQLQAAVEFLTTGATEAAEQ